MPLMTYEEYAKIEYEHPVPYKFILNLNSNSLYFFGEDHFFDPSNNQWSEEKPFWLDFLEKTKKTKRIVFVEGGKPLVEATEAEAIMKSGGAGFITYLASKESIDTYCPEPTEREQRALLEKNFSREQIQYYYFARLIPQWHRKQDPKPDFEMYMSDYLGYHKRQSNWPEFEFSIEAMERIHKNIFHKDFDKNDAEFFKNITTPVETTTVINNVARECSNIRDIYIVEQIIKYLSDGYSIYAQYGCTHAVRQESLLRKLLNNPAK